MKAEIFRINFFNTLSAIIHKKNALLQPHHNHDIKQKVLDFLQRMFIDCDGQAEVSIKMIDLAEYIGETRLNTSRALNELEDEQIIELKRSLIVIPDVKKLQ
jgi:CRP-like cAMP-binding protein